MRINTLEKNGCVEGDDVAGHSKPANVKMADQKAIQECCFMHCVQFEALGIIEQGSSCVPCVQVEKSY